MRRSVGETGAFLLKTPYKVPNHSSKTVLSIVKIGPPKPASLPADCVSLSSNDHLRYGVVASYPTISFFRSLLNISDRTNPV